MKRLSRPLSDLDRAIIRRKRSGGGWLNRKEYWRRKAVFDASS
jgi:hypothetical protein